MSAPSGRTTLVIPCYNEAERLPVADYRAFLVVTEAIDFLFVDDGSTDGTFELLQEMAASGGNRVSALRLPENRGKAEAVRAGILAALESDPRYVGFWDADLATPLDSVLEFRETLELNDDLDWVLGSRVRLLGRKIDRKIHRHYLGRAMATMFSAWLHLPVYDTQCRAKMFRASDELRAIFTEPFVTGWLFDVELLARLIESRGDIAEVRRSVIECPLPRWIDVKGSKLGMRSVGPVLRDLVRLRLKYAGSLGRGARPPKALGGSPTR
jgi:glycosyltransferase involved in cell wall biosynthesis